MDFQRNPVTPCSASENGSKSERSLRSGATAEPSSCVHCDAAGESVRLRTIGLFTLNERIYPGELALP